MIDKFEPKWVAWEITRRCNLKCVHCRSSSEMAIEGHPDFTTEEGYRVIDDIASYSKPVVVLSGGEPLLRKGLASLVEMIAGVPGIDFVGLTTNGTRLASQ